MNAHENSIEFTNVKRENAYKLKSARFNDFFPSFILSIGRNVLNERALLSGTTFRLEILLCIFFKTADGKPKRPRKQLFSLVTPTTSILDLYPLYIKQTVACEKEEKRIRNDFDCTFFHVPFSLY